MRSGQMSAAAVKLPIAAPQESPLSAASSSGRTRAVLHPARAPPPPRQPPRAGPGKGRNASKRPAALAAEPGRPGFAAAKGGPPRPDSRLASNGPAAARGDSGRVAAGAEAGGAEAAGGQILKGVLAWLRRSSPSSTNAWRRLILLVAVRPPLTGVHASGPVPMPPQSSVTLASFSRSPRPPALPHLFRSSSTALRAVALPSSSS
mmetsp:Transcript_44436/g.92953  ORF Transcript_44436/g.92953 Transcript_44436/m.92953 type:complete len:205 (-) Transcript_44436:2043-2657(-)